MYIGKDKIKVIGIVGTGVIGAGWAARFLYRGFDVIATDPGPNAEALLNEVVENSAPALEKIVFIPKEKRGKLTFVKDLAEAVKNVDFIIESAPEVEQIKVDLLANITKSCKPDIIIGTSTSGLLPSNLQRDMVNPERLVVAHPFNPVYLLPLVELVGGKKTDPTVLDTAADFLKTVGMHPLKVRKEIDGFLADRLLEAVWREILHLVNDDIATTDELDQAIIYGAGLRWAFMGTNLTYWLAGGKNGMHHFMKQFGPALKLPWTKLEAPELTEELINKMADGTNEQAQGLSLRELEQKRDNCIVSVMKALEENDYASGKTIKEDARIQTERLSL